MNATNKTLAVPLAIALAFLAGFSAYETHLLVSKSSTVAANQSIQTGAIVDSRDLILLPEAGNGVIDKAIADLQSKIKNSKRSEEATRPLIVDLGWAFISKARLSNDPGYYKIAEQCAIVAGENDPGAQLLRGHVFHAMHRFHDAEMIARHLVTLPEANWQEYALLGDSLMEQGQLEESVAAYQKMLDLKPCLQTFSRVAHLRWLKGDVVGAEEIMRNAVEAGSSRDPEPAAWTYTRLGFYQFQNGQLTDAQWSIDRALQFVGNYPAALLLRGKILLSQNKPSEAIKALEIAATANPLPEYEWLLADALRSVGGTSQLERAAVIEKRLKARGATDDPRTYSLFLSTRRENSAKALQLAKAELVNRRDVFTYDAVAWASLAEGKIDDAKTNIAKALAEGTTDARIFYHAGVIAEAAGNNVQADEYLKKASLLQQLLFPLERADFLKQVSTLNPGSQVTAKADTPH